MTADEELDVLVRATASITDDEVRRLPLSGSEAEVLEGIVFAQSTRSERNAWQRRVFAAAAAAVIAVVGIISLNARGQSGGSGHAWGAPIVAIARQAPRFLVDLPAWKVTRADQFAAETGEMTFSDGTRQLELRWTPVSELTGTIDDRTHSADRREAIKVAGHDATLFRYEGTTDFTTLWDQGGHAMEARGDFPTIDKYRAVLAALHEVGVDSWLSAMPESVVKPVSRAATVDQMLADIPQPAGYDASSLRDGDDVQDRYQLGAHVSGSVACAWIGSWIAAVDQGDSDGAQKAVDAMATSHRWKVLADMNAAGDYPEVLWELADAMRTDAPVSGGRPMTIRESYRASLGCRDR
jgi:hypothetical protein